LGQAKIVIYRPVDAAGDSHRELAQLGCEVHVESIDLPGAQVRSEAREADVLMGATFRGGVMTSEFLSQFPNLRLVSKYTIGYDDVDLDAATSQGVLVTNCPTEANYGGVAEGTVAMMLALLKKLRERDAHIRAGGWRDPELQGTYLGARGDGYAGLTVGIIGLGRVGTRVAELLSPWRVRLVACDPHVEADRFERCGVERLALESLLAESDIVTLHCDLNRETRGLIDRESLELMRPDAILVNTARGAIVDLKALTCAIESGRLAGAALDVFPEEPLPTDAPIRSLGMRVLLSPHMVAANQGGTLQASIPMATEATLAAIRGVRPANVVNGGAVAAWTRRFGGKSLL